VTGKRRVALISSTGHPRTELAGYLRNAGFDVHECEEMSLPSAFAALVVIGGESAEEIADVQSWMKVAKTQRVVVVTPKPTAFKYLLAIHGHRLQVLPAPVFGWDLVDALRAAPPARPRGA
jgi:hypothetical protein